MWVHSYWTNSYWTNSYWEGQESLPETVSSGITFSQTITVHKVISELVLSSLSLTTHISSNEIIIIVDPQVLALGQTYSIGRELSRTVSDNLLLTQTIRVNKSLSENLQSNLVLVQTFQEPIRRNLSFTSYLNIVQSLTGSDRLKQTITQALHLTQDTATNRQFTHHVISTLSLSQSIKLLDQSVKHTLSFTQDIKQLHQFLSDHLVLTQLISNHHIANLTVTDHLNFIQDIVARGPHYLTVTDQLVFNEPYYTKLVPLNNTYIQLPVVIGLLVPRRYCIRLRPYSPSKSVQEILLNCPAFGDSESGTSSINSKRTMTGALYTYAKNSTNRKLKYNFLLDRNKSLELRNFVQRHLSDLLILENWKGEQWLSYITSNPISLVPKSRGVYCNSEERVQAEIEFTGSRLN